MKFQIDHDYHIHSFTSSCAKDPAQTPQRILQYAKDAGLAKICLTNHYWDSAVPGASRWYTPQNFDHIAQDKPLPQTEGVEFLFGCETDMDRHGTIGLPPSRYDDFDFIIVPTTHLHMRNFTILEEDMQSIEKRAQLWIERFDALLKSDLPMYKVGVAHLTCDLINNVSHEATLNTLALIPDAELERLFAASAQRGCGIELNYYDIKYIDDPEILRFYRIAKECGNKFYLGSDVHEPHEFPSEPYYERAIELLGLTEDDKFFIGKHAAH